MEEYVPFGDEWKTEMMKYKKSDLVNIIKAEWVGKKALYKAAVSQHVFKSDLRKLVEDQRMDTCSADEYCDSCADMRSFLGRIDQLLNGGE